MKLVVFILKSGLKQFNQFRQPGYTYAYLDSQKLFPESRLKGDYEEVILVDSTSSSGITLLKAKTLLENRGFRNIKLSAYPVTKYVRALIDIPLPKQEPRGSSIFVVGLPGSGKSAFAYGLAHALNGLYVRWGKEVSARFNVGKYGEELAKLEAENPFIVSERLIIDGVFDTEKEFIVVDGVKTIWQAIHVSYSTLRPAIPFFIEVSPEVREFTVNVRGMVDDPYDDERKALFSENLNEIRNVSIIVRFDEKYMNKTTERIFKTLGIEPTIRGYFNPFITKEILLESWFRSWKKANNIYTPLIDRWINSLNIRLHRGYVERLRRKDIKINEDIAEIITLSATAARIIDDILDEHTIRFYSEEGISEEAWWVRRGIYLAVIDSIALMVKARRIARKLGIESDLINTFERMINAVKVELELEITRRKPTVDDWLKAVDREAAFREFVYKIVGLDPMNGYIEGVIAQAKDDLYGVTKGGREDTDTQLNRPLFQRIYSKPEDVLDELKKAKTKEDILTILQGWS